jgi:gas vesicle protein
MDRNKHEQAAIFLLGAALGTAIGLILATLFAPYSGQETRQLIKTRSADLKTKVIAESDDFSQRIRAATDDWVAQLREIADDLVAQGRMSADEARAQIDDLLIRMRG